MKFVYLVVFLLSFNVFAGVEVQNFNKPEQEHSYKKLVNELRCLVCQNQNLADSNAELAQDLRKKIVEMISSGKSEEEIIQYMVARYGDFVLYRPPLNQSTFLLWFGPFILFLTGIAVLVIFVRRQHSNNKPLLSGEQQKRVKKLLDEDNDEEGN